MSNRVDGERDVPPESLLDFYDYSLPKELIAQHPLPNRTDARLMIVDRQAQRIDHYYVRDLPKLLREDDCMVVNDTQVIPARLVGRRQTTGGRWQGLFLRSDEAGNWQLLCKTRGRLEEGEVIELFDKDTRHSLDLRLTMRLSDGSWVARPLRSGPWLQLLKQIGHVPLPPYIRGGKMVDDDQARYQTTFATRPGSVAAPTAGLHLTPQLLDQLKDSGVVIARVTLHVGVGTFKPITSQRIDQHQMHYEWGSIDRSAARVIALAKQRGGRIIAVGSTSTRLLETAAHAARLESGQLGSENSGQAVDEMGNLPDLQWEGETNLFIKPGYKWRMVDGMMTNFHLPRTTLLVLVTALAGGDLIKQAYEQAVQEKYRFFSYGDAMLIL